MVSVHVSKQEASRSLFFLTAVTCVALVIQGCSLLSTHDEGARTLTEATEPAAQAPKCEDKKSQTEFMAVASSDSRNASLKPAPEDFQVMEFKTLEVGDTYAVVSWKTNYPALSRIQINEVEFSVESLTSTAQADATVHHRVRVNGLKKAQKYEIAAVAALANGLARTNSSTTSITTSY